jgi:hypothetical protein
MGSINAVPSYTAYYNLPSEGNGSTGLVFAIFQIGQMVGAFFSWVADWHGRRWPIFIGCFDMRWRHCDSSRTNNPSIHRRSLHAIVLLDRCNGCGPDLFNRDRASSTSRYCGWPLQHPVLSGKFTMWSWVEITNQVL